ncbi:MAG: hypothetical protein JSU05_04830 [Bacteroidetes bacterium]|nr:hypothetical protein [Bacteroidota bacterium]
MVKISALLLLLTGSAVLQPIKAQYYFYNSRYYEKAILFELGVSAGGMNCFTDLGGKRGTGKSFIKDLNLKNTRPSLSVYLTGTYKYAVGLKLEATFGSISAYDSILKPVALSTYGRYERNFDFKSKITDLQFAFEIHPLFFKAWNEDPPRWSPYLVAGIGFFSFNPQTKLNGRWYNLQPLHTEGQGFLEYSDRKPYKLQQVNFPLGFGIKYEISALLNTRFEFVHRILTTDYLDDVSTNYINPSLFFNYLPSQQAGIAAQLADRQGDRIPGHITDPGQQRGNSKNNDSYFSFQFKLGVTLGRTRR